MFPSAPSAPGTFPSVASPTYGFAPQGTPAPAFTDPFRRPGPGMPMGPVSFGVAQPAYFAASAPPTQMQPGAPEALRTSSGAQGYQGQWERGSPAWHELRVANNAVTDAQNQSWYAQSEQQRRQAEREQRNAIVQMMQAQPARDAAINAYRQQVLSAPPPVHQTAYQPASPQYAAPSAPAYSPFGPGPSAPAYSPFGSAPSAPATSGTLFNFPRGGKRTTRKRQKTRKHGHTRVRRRARGRLSRRKVKA
jgi:hypothetical protein